MGKKSSHNMVWMDLEMTGLDPEKELIIEIATLVTDGELNILEEGPSLAIKQSNAILSRMDAWNTTTHQASGLTERVMHSKISCQDAETATLDFIKQYCPPETTPLCGNSIGQDRRFLVKYMPELHDYLHYRSVDVTTIKELVKRWYPKGPKFPKKSGVHKASIDVRESLEELIFYRKHYISNGVPALTANQKTS
ncbi:3'-to-5' oligoribonuclease (orn) [hydrothermal vent metagenome]|uniref:3'-to-5' oligoribonuclease (Orn) n=1 Tax=hydrothermal vent metagenome TaxID=652676 RepID=A0A3B1C0E3_9ZZZZ